MPRLNVVEKGVSTTPGRLRSALGLIVEESVALTRGIAVRPFERDAGGLVFPMATDFYFDTLGPPQQAAQMKLKRRYEAFSEILRVLLRAAPEKLVSQWREADERFREAWVELGTNYALSSDRARNEAALRKDVEALEQVISVFDVGEAGVLIVAPTRPINRVGPSSGARRENPETR